MEGKKKILAIIGLFAVLASVLGGVWFFSREKDGEVKENVVQEVTVKRDDSSLTINRNGTMTIRNKYGVFQQQWDDARVRDFFARFDALDYSKYSTVCQAGAYCFSIILGNGSQYSFSISDFEIDIPDVIQELIEELEELDDVIPTPTPTPVITQAVTPTPTSYYYPSPTPTYPPNPTPTPTGGGQTGDGKPPGGAGLPDYYNPFECEFSYLDTGTDVLSETVCDQQR